MDRFGLILIMVLVAFAGAALLTGLTSRLEHARVTERPRRRDDESLGA